MKRNILKSMIVGLLLAAGSLASKFNTNAGAKRVTLSDLNKAFTTPSHKRPFSTGIKGMASSNNTRYGAGLRNRFDAIRRSRFPFSDKKVAA